MPTTRRKKSTKESEPAATWVAIDALTPWADNPRKNDGRPVEAVADSIKRFGFAAPIIARQEDGMVIAGHTRLKAAIKLGLDRVPVRYLDLDPADSRLLALADNKVGELAEWDDEALARIVADIDGAELALAGFTEEDLGDILAAVDGGPVGPDDIEPEEPPEDPDSKRGEVYELGPHRLACGDATDPETVSLLLDGASPGIMVTDPPYGVEYDPQWREEALPRGARALGTVRNDDRADWGEAWRLFPGDVAYVWHDALRPDVTASSLLDSGLSPRSHIVWVKPRAAISRGHYSWQHEACLHVYREGGDSRWAGPALEPTVWDAGASEMDTGHGTQKPIECMERPLRNHSHHEVFDPFAGSGTTLIAAARLGRVAYCVEIDPGYCDVIRKRWTTWADEAGVDAGPGALR